MGLHGKDRWFYEIMMKWDEMGQGVLSDRTGVGHDRIGVFMMIR